MLQLDRERVRAMPPMDRRRTRRRRSASWLLVILAVGIVLALLIGGLVDVGKASRSYQRSVDRSYAQESTLIVQQSNQSGVAFTGMVPVSPGYRRSELQQQLDSLVAATSNQATIAKQQDPPAPASQAASDLTASLNDRALALSEFRNAAFGLLGMQPQVARGAANTKANGSASPVPVTTSEAQARMSDVANLTIRSDAEYRAFRQNLQSSVGHPRAPASVWVAHPHTWSSTLSDLPGALVSSASLAPQHQVVLAPNGVRLTPAAVPPGAQPGGQNGVPAGASVVPPTGTLGVQAVVANQGNVTEHNIVVTASLQPASAGATADSSSTHVTMTPGTFALAPLPSLRVSPGREYTLTVSVKPPAGQNSPNGASASFTLWIAPATAGSGATTSG